MSPLIRSFWEMTQKDGTANGWLVALQGGLQGHLDMTDHKVQSPHVSGVALYKLLSKEAKGWRVGPTAGQPCLLSAQPSQQVGRPF